MELFFFTTSGCHLCEEALELWSDVHSADWMLKKIDIAEQDILIERYGTKIPVFKRCDDGKELIWPFSRHDLHKYLLFCKEE